MFNFATATNNITKVLSALKHLGKTVKKTGDNEYLCQCPAHDDHNPSLIITELLGMVLIHCRAGCDHFNVIRALKLYDEYTYHNEAGEEKYFVRKLEDKSYPVFTTDGTPGLKDGQKFLYRLPELLAHKEGYVFIPEGEKDVNTLVALGLTATTNLGGSGGWRDSYNQSLKNKSIVLLPDNDAPGRKHVKGIAKALSGIAKEIRIVELPDLPEKGDVTDWLESGKTLEDLVMEVNQTELYTSVATSSGPPPPVLPPTKQPKKTTKDGGFSGHRFTDIGNGKRFADQHHAKLRFCQSTRKWLYYDEIKWNEEKGRGMAENLGKLTAQKIVEEDIGDITRDQRDKIYSWACQSGGAARIDAMLKMAQSEETTMVYGGSFDQNKMLLNVQNGTWDLDIFKFRNHNPNDLITQAANVTYDPDAKSQWWLDCLEKWMGGDKDKIDYLQRFAGLCLTGDISSRAFLIFYGGGHNGKSVFLNTVAKLLGDYATVAPKGFLKAKKYEEHPTEIARLFKKRLVVAQETEERMKLEIALVKMMTGEQQMTGRFMRKDHFDFDLTNKIVLMANHRPIISDTSNSIWDRVHLLNWDVRISEAERDSQLIEKLLETERSGIFNWMLEGCRKWKADNYFLVKPDCIRLATEQYREESDPLSSFVKTCCEFEETAITPIKDLWATYEVWAIDEGVKYPIGQPRFKGYFCGLGYKNGQKWLGGANVKCWLGIGLRDTKHRTSPK